MSRWLTPLFVVGLVVPLRAEPPASPPTTSPPAPTTAPSVPETAPAEEAQRGTAFKEVFPGVLLNEERKTIELPGRVPIMADVGDETVVFLEQLVCSPDTKEHEVLVVVKAKPSHVHAALLLLGIEPGKPASWTVEDGALVPHAPEGPELDVEFVYTDADGAEQTAKPGDWVVNYRNLDEHLPDQRPVFAGSAMKKLRDGTERYYADGEGTLIGLASFCTEVIAWPVVFSPESSQHEPEWIAAKSMPKVDTPVRVRIRVSAPPVEEEPPTDAPETPAEVPSEPAPD